MQSLARPAFPAGTRALRWAVRRARATYRKTLSGTSPIWDVLAVTAANEPQAAGCLQELSARQEAGLLPRATRLMAIPDPNGMRIGSGGATRRAIALVERDIGLEGRRVLIIHSGGDSRRVPHCSPIGKLFMHLPTERDDGGPASLFDLLYILLAGAAGRMQDGVLIASGDVLLAFDPNCLDLTAPGFVGIAIRAPLEIGRNHGVYVPNAHGTGVHAFLQKPTADQMRRAGAVGSDGRVLVDTGLLKLDLDAARALVQLPIPEFDCLDLYDDVLPALPPNADADSFLANPDRKQAREAVWRCLHGASFSVCAPSPAEFIHLGTTREACLAVADGSAAGSIFGFTSAASSYTAPSVSVEGATVIASVLTNGGCIGPGALVDACRMTGPVNLEPDAVAVGLDLRDTSLHLRAGVCLHELHVVLDQQRAVVWRLYGVDDNPKLTIGEGATFLGTDLAHWLKTCGIAPEEVWHGIPEHERCLWSARLYPVMPRREPDLVLWMQEPTPPHPDVLTRWRQMRRLSMAESAELADVTAAVRHQNLLAHEAVRLQVQEWIEQDVPTEQVLTIVQNRPRVLRTASATSELAEADEAAPHSLRRARMWRLRADLLRALGAASHRREIRESDARAFAEVAVAVEAGVPVPAPAQKWAVPIGSQITVECPARIDFGGGWSDTPPHCLERGGTVLNAAVLLSGKKPVSVYAKIIPEPVIRLHSLDQRRTVTITQTEDVLNIASARGSLGLHRAALVISGVVPKGLSGPLAPVLERLGGGIELYSQCVAPKGSGLGTSSILGWCLLTTLHHALGKEAQPLISQVLLMEQMLTTGGGWQDQAGGAIPGIKLLRSEPGISQTVSAEKLDLPDPVLRELRARLVLFYTGKRRLAKNILRTIMGRWLSRDPLVVYVLSRIRDIACEMKECLLDGNLDRFGKLLSEHWELNKLMDPKTTDAEIERLFAAARPLCLGGKLAGAGGGGFMIILAKDDTAAHALRRALSEASGGQGQPFSFELDLQGPSVEVSTCEKGYCRG
ncbi:MAG: fucose pyrophosphorylase domain-containing protein [Armatimonadota bacterium]